MDVMKLKMLLIKHGITQTELARLLGRDKSVVTNLMQGRRQLKADEAALIAQRLNVPVAELIGIQEQAVRGVEEQFLIPFQQEPKHLRKGRQVVQKGGRYFLEESGAFTDKAFALEVRDDGLNLAGILPGDIIISELDRTCKSGQFVVAQRYQGRGADTIIRRLESPFLMSHSTNPSHKPLHLEEDDVRVVSPVMKLVRLM